MFKILTRADNAPSIFAATLAIGYAVVPAIVSRATGISAFDDLIALALVSSIVTWVGSKLPLFDWVHSPFFPRVSLVAERTLFLVWVVFFAFVCLVWVTAPSIPLLDAFGGADARAIATARELFLKARTGWQASFVYINAVLAGALVPYSLAVMFLTKFRYRWICFAFFFFYSISFVEKAFFFKAALPLVYLALQGRLSTGPRGGWLMAGLAGMLLFVTSIAGSEASDEVPISGFFSTSFIPTGAVSKVVWRSTAIPVVTASDGIRLFKEEFRERPLGGATSTLLAALVGERRVEFERLTFASQFGQNETETGSANSVFFVEALVNFGWAGVVVFSLLVGLILRTIATSRDEALRSIWILFALGVYTSGLIGVLFSNGFALVIPMALVATWRPSERGLEASVSKMSPAV